MKARALHDLSGIDFGPTRVAIGEDRLAEMSSESEQRAHALMAEAGAALHGGEPEKMQIAKKPRRRARPVAGETA